LDARWFDSLVRTLAVSGRRRDVLGVLATLPLLGGLLSPFAEETEGRGRRKRRKKGHKHAQGDGKKNRKGKRKRKNKGKGEEPCQPESAAQTCEGKCGTVQNTCQKPVDCDPCDCDPPCGACETCSNDLICEACDPCCDDVCCNQASAVCHADSGACCMPDSRAQTCGDACGDVVNNCGISVDCGPCTCGSGCPECKVCDEDADACIPDAQQVGDGCGAVGQVCRADGTCSCEVATCPDCTACAGNGLCEVCAGCCEDGQCVASCGACQVCADGQCVSCPDCCDGDGGVCRPGTTNAACGSSGICDICSGQEQCQNQTCVCVPNCIGKNCGPNGCGGQCGTCTAPNTCGGGGTPGVCGCARTTCAAQGKNCGTIPDGCGGALNCGNCGGAAPICANNVCTACTSSTQCPANTICEGGSCRACDVCLDGSCDYDTVQAAVATGGPTTIRICPGTYVSGVTIGRNLSLIGSGDGTGAGDTILDAQATIAVIVNNGVTATLQGLRITDGLSPFGGGGILNRGTSLSMTDCTVTGNLAGSLTTGADGGGVYNAAGSTLTMTDCRIEGNQARKQRIGSTEGEGGGLYNQGTATLTRCSMNNNTAEDGGGIFNDGGTTTLDFTGVHANTANAGAGGVRNLSGTVILQNTSLVTFNSQPNCVGVITGSGCGQ
jgi:hypothetical protein